MLRIEIPSVEVFDEETSTFAWTKPVVLSLEHSLMSVSKWESKWCVPFLSKDDKSSNQMRDYIRCMTLTQNVDDSVYALLSLENIELITAYIEAPMTATTIRPEGVKGREIVTSEVIYSWLVLLNIPFDPCQKWHLNRLLALVAVCNDKQKVNKPRLKGNALARSNTDLNRQRRAMLNSSG